MFCGHFWDNWLEKLDVTPESDAERSSEVEPVLNRDDPRGSLRVSCKLDDRERDANLSHLAFAQVIVSVWESTMLCQQCEHRPIETLLSRSLACSRVHGERSVNLAT